MRRGLGLLLLGVAALLAPASALAAAPANDDRANAQVVHIPANVDGTTADSTRETGEPASGCAQDGGSVWYRVNTTDKGRLILSLTAAGNLDAVVDVYRLQRSQISGVTCETTDSKGDASLDFNVKPGESYLIRVSQLQTSAPGTFQLRLQMATPPAKPPGTPLPRGGARGTLDRVFNPSAAYSFRMREGVTYRLHLATGTECTPLLIYGPHTHSFNANPVGGLRCGGYTVFTPRGGKSGRYTLLAKASSRRGPVPYRLTAAAAGPDDTTPGRQLPNYSDVRGRLTGGGIDVIDLYRFDVKRRSSLRLTLQTRGDFVLELRKDTGGVLSSSTDEIRASVRRGRYYAVVIANEGSGAPYRLSRLTREITHTKVSADGKRAATVPPGQAVKLAATVTPGVAGPVRIVVERFDPLEGWQYSTRFDIRSAGGGTATVSWRPPTVGRYRVVAAFQGTRGASSSVSSYAKVRVEAPLKGKAAAPASRSRR
ncbi:MAG: hypothetical protein QOF37_659 [Thermoleophilaceae bacterium]|nr:hypothetical protein [Thermoleophilaceae bacterium]